MTQPRLFPAFPNEIGDLIISRLSFFNLVTGYFASKSWRHFLEDNDDIRRAMFRLPKRFDNVDEQTCIDFINGLWDEIADRDDNDDDWPTRLWAKVAINPIFCSPKAKAITRDGIACTMDSQKGFDISRLPNVPRCSRNRLRDLWGSMFVAYPPVTRIHIVEKRVPRKCAYVSPWHSYYTDLLRPAGVMAGDLWNATKRPDHRHLKQKVLLLCPEGLYSKDSVKDEEE
jgi:hypothetical protein